MTAALDAIRARDAAWGAETPGGKPWTSRQRGEAYFQAGYDRHVLLAALDRAEAVVVALKRALSHGGFNLEREYDGNGDPRSDYAAAKETP